MWELNVTDPLTLTGPATDGVADPTPRPRSRTAATRQRVAPARRLARGLSPRRLVALVIAAALLIASVVLVLAHSPAGASSTTANSADAQAPADKTDTRGAAKKNETRDRAAGESRAAARGRATSDASSTKQISSSSRGSDTSWYTGRYYSADYESFRRCVVHRESRGDYTARNTRSGASGAYQFMLTTSNEVARRMGHPELVGSPAGTWSRALQDEAFFTLLDHGRGISHWGGSCG